MITLRSLNDRGRREAADMLAHIRAGELQGPDMSVLDGEDHSRVVPLEFAAPAAAETATRWHLGCWLLTNFIKQHEQLDAGAWSWLALKLFDVLCPLREGRRTVREDARYLLEAGDYRKSHRHLLTGPFLLLKAHQGDPGSVRGLLATAPDAPGEVYEQLAARKYTVTSAAVVRVATRLYLDPSSGKLKRGAGGAAGGSPRRLSEVLQQLDVTYDLQSISAERLLGILPGEFARFMKT
jgi:hypothetical protein